MKRLLPLAALLLYFSQWSLGQRTGDIEVQFISPANGYQVQFQVPVTLQIRIYNHGPSAVTSTDTLWVKQFHNGMDVLLFPESLGYLLQNSIPVGDSLDLTRAIAFTEGVETIAGNFTECFEIYVRNGVDPMEEQTIPNNRSCVQFMVWDGSSVGIAGVNEIEWSVYPNPFQNEMRVQGKAGDYDLKVIHADGRVVAQQQVALSNDSVQINSAQWEPGVYVLQLSQGDQIWNKRVVRL